jgi:hypothetical protein
MILFPEKMLKSTGFQAVRTLGATGVKRGKSQRSS